MKNRNRKSFGFTLVELLVVVVIIGILAAIALPNFIGAQGKAKTAAVKGNMRTVQIASESYATDSGGSYSANTAYQNYLPGGSNTISGGTAGNIPLNPVSGQATVIGAALATSAAISSQRTKSASTSAGLGSPGDMGYSQADAGNSYSVIGADNTGNYCPGVGGNCLVLSNQ